MPDGKGESGYGFNFRLTFVFDDVEIVNAGEADDVCGHFTGGAIDDLALDGLAVEKLIVVGAKLFAGIADFVGKCAPKGVVVFTEQRQQ